MLKLAVCDSEKIIEIVVGMGEMKVAESPDLLKVVGIGSCVAVTLYDRYTRTGGLAHVMIPSMEESHNRIKPGRFADVAIDMMIDEMEMRGSLLQNITARMYGGANMFPGIIAPDSAMDIGRRNTRAVRNELIRHNIGIVNEDVGGYVGRTVLFDTSDGSVILGIAQTEDKRIHRAQA